MELIPHRCILCALLVLCVVCVLVSASTENSTQLKQNANSEVEQQKAAGHQLDPPEIHNEQAEALELIEKTVETRKGNGTKDVTFYHAVLASFSVIIVSELGDKTWFIAAIMAMRHSRLTVFLGAVSALALMTALSAGLGWATQIIPRTFTFYISTALFALFGLKMLHEGYNMSPTEGQEEYDEAHAQVNKQQLLRDSDRVSDMESGIPSTNNNSPYAIVRFVSSLFLEAFTLTFLAEWGDRSQLTTIILAARENVYGVVLGGVAGHALCTGIAVIGGKLVATQISVRTVTIIGGFVFLLFALSALFIRPE